MPQTKFVTAKALKLGLKPIVVINKADKPDARLEDVHEEVFDLFAALDATDEQLDFPLLIASAKEGWAGEDMSAQGTNLEPLFAQIVKHVPEPTVYPDAPFSI